MGDIVSATPRIWFCVGDGNKEPNVSRAAVGVGVRVGVLVGSVVGVGVDVLVGIGVGVGAGAGGQLLGLLGVAS